MIKAVVFDVDGVILKGISFWDALWDLVDGAEKKEELVELYLKGKITIEELHDIGFSIFKEKGIKLEDIEKILENLEITKGAHETINKLKEKYGERNIAFISAGLDVYVNRLAKDMGIKHVKSNELEIIENDFTGKIFYNINEKNHKGLALKEICVELGVTPEETAVICDGKEDIEMCRIAGLSIAFNPMVEELEEEADYTIRGNDLMEIMKFL